MMHMVDQKKYLTPFIRQHLAQMTAQDVSWFWMLIEELEQYFPDLDYYPHSDGAWIGVGIKPTTAKKGSNYFYIGVREKPARFVGYVSSRKVEYSPKSLFGVDAIEQHQREQVVEWLVSLKSDLQLFNLKGQGLRPSDYPEEKLSPVQASVGQKHQQHPDPTEIKIDPKKSVNKIFYGAAGTGKTYHLQQLQRAYTEQLTQQDHATFLAEKLRDLTWRDVICLVFLDEQRLLRVPDIVGHPYFRAKVSASNRTDNINQTVWGTLMRHTPAESTTVKYALKRRADLALFDKDEAGLWRLLDTQDDLFKTLHEQLATLKQGAQPSETIERFSFVTFHQSYGYEDFIEGLRPVLNDDSEDGQVRYEIRQGVFVELCERARHDPEHGYAMFIDEINRGNVSKILGELITLIELDKREGQPNAIRVRLPYSGEWFSVPANLSIYGSMNSADRSLTPLDTALRRRFEFEEIMPDPSLLAGQVVEGVALDQLLTVINARIELLLGRDCLLGHAYFYPVRSFADLQTVMQQQIVPQLQEYFFDDWRKIRWVLNDHRKPERLQFIHEHDSQAQMLALFGQELDVAIQPTYALNATAFDQIDSYRMILAV